MYAAALAGQGWGEVLEVVSGSLHASSAFLFSDRSADGGAYVQTHNHDPAMAQGFLHYWHAHDEWARGARTRGVKPGEVVSGSHLIPTAELRRTAFHADFLRLHAMEEMMGSMLFSGQGGRAPFTHVCWYRPPGARPFEESALRTLKCFVPHLQRAMLLQRRMSWVIRDCGSATFDAMYVAAFVLDAQARIVHCNDAATAFLRATGGSGARGGRLRAIGERCAPSLIDALCACTPTRPVRMAAFMPGSVQQVLSCTVISMREGVESQSHGNLFLVLVELPRTDGRTVAREVASLFQLTPAETRVLGELLAGGSPVDIAQACGSSMPTVRTQMSAIFAKTATRSQTELILLLRGMRF